MAEGGAELGGIDRRPGSRGCIMSVIRCHMYTCTWSVYRLRPTVAAAAAAAAKPFSVG